MIRTTYEKAAIIGMWRMGASNDQIAIHTGIIWRSVCAVIEDYKEQLFSRGEI